MSSAIKPESHKPSIMDSQFGHPSGLLGSLIGITMAIEHKSLHKEVVDRLGLKSNDRVLEIGFGPGTAIKLAAAKADFVAGIDPSEQMVRQAERRNRLGIKSGHIQIAKASASAIPFASENFSVAFEVNSYHHWDIPEVGLKETFRVLQVGGRLLMTLRQGHGKSNSLQQEAEQIAKILKNIGFEQLSCQEHHSGHGGIYLSAVRC